MNSPGPMRSDLTGETKRASQPCYRVGSVRWAGSSNSNDALPITHTFAPREQIVLTGLRFKQTGRTLGVVMIGAILLGAGTGAAQPAPGLASLQATGPDVPLRARMAAITLDETALPDGYAFEGETFLTAEQSASGSIDAAALTDAGFVGQYISVYTDDAATGRIRTYVTAWNDAAAAEAGFAVIEDETRSLPDAELTDADASVGETPREVTTGSHPDPVDAETMIATVDVTFRVDRFLVGVAVEDTTGTGPDPATATALAAELEGRATAAVGNQNPERTDLALVPKVLPLGDLGTELQAGFLSPAEVEQLYGLQGSALGGFSSSWSEAVGLGSGDNLAPYIAVGATTFANDADATAVIEQAAELTPAISGVEPVDAAEVQGATQAVAFRFPSPATGAETIDSYRVIFSVGATVGVVDVQGAASPEIAEQSALALAGAQTACFGAETCAAPTLPGELTGQ